MTHAQAAALRVEPYTLTDCANLVLLFNHHIVPALASLFQCAKRDIFVVQYHFRPGTRPRREFAQILDALLAAADRGVRVRILLNHPRQPRTRPASHGSLYADLEHPGIKIRHHRDSQVLHSKLSIIDEEVTVMGSHNYSQPSFSTSQNVSVIIQAPTFALRVLRVYDELWETSTNGVCP